MNLKNFTITTPTSFKRFNDKYAHEWVKGKVSDESVQELLDIIRNIDLEYSMCTKIMWDMYYMIVLMIRYRFSGTQSIKWIEPIRMRNWSLHCMVMIDPKIAELSYDIQDIEADVGIGFYYTYEHDSDEIHPGEDMKHELAEEFTVKNLADIDYVENYLKTYAKNDRVKRYLQMV